MKCGLGYLIYLPFFFPSVCHPATSNPLERLIASALQNHPAIQVQQAQARAASASLDSANWQFFPTPSVALERASTGSSDAAYAGDSTVSTLRLQQPLWTGGRLTAGREKAKAAILVSETALEETRQQLALRVLQTYCDWLAAHLKVQAHEKSLATHVRLREQVKRRIELGASAESDLILAMGRLQSVTADISLANAQKNTALARLRQLTGNPIDEPALSSAIAAPRPLAGELQSLLDLALATHPTIKKAQAQAQVQEFVVAERRADLSPEVYVRAERQFGNFSSRNAPPENRIFIGLSSRFGAGLSSLSHVEGAKAEHQALLAEVDVQSRSVSEQVLADHALATSSTGRLEALRATLKAATQVAESYDRQFLSGRKTWLDVMNAARELAQTEVQLADIEASQVIVTWRLAIYGGGLANVMAGGQ
jgi:adhesin transport system outer membrane protein